MVAGTEEEPATVEEGRAAVVAAAVVPAAVLAMVELSPAVVMAEVLPKTELAGTDAVITSLQENAITENSGVINRFMVFLL